MKKKTPTESPEERRKRYDRMRYYLEKEKRLEMQRRYKKTEKGKAAAARARANWIAKNPEKRRAQVAVGNAIRDGRLEKKPCEFCGEIKVEAHHHDYSRPLDVVWLCKAHHGHTRRRYQEAA